MSSTGPGCEMAKTVMKCQVRTPAHRLMCRNHWYQVTPGVRARVWNTVDLRDDAYWAAVADAVNDVLVRNGHEQIAERPAEVQGEVTRPPLGGPLPGVPPAVSG